VAYEDKHSCPACAAMEKRKELEKELEQTKDLLQDATMKLAELQDELEPLRSIAGIGEVIQPRRTKVVGKEGA